MRFDAAAHDIEALEILVDPARGALTKTCSMLGREALAMELSIGIDGHLAPADQTQGLSFQLLVDDVASGLGQDGIGVENSMPTA
jgi:hypothetical protein